LHLDKWELQEEALIEVLDQFVVLQVVLVLVLIEVGQFLIEVGQLLTEVDLHLIEDHNLFVQPLLVEIIPRNKGQLMLKK